MATNNRGSGIEHRRGEDPERGAPSWMTWRLVLYVFVLGWICVFLVPLTGLWWLALVGGVALPVVLAYLNRRGSPDSGSPDSVSLDDGKLKERELLAALSESGELTPTTAAMKTSLTVEEASKRLEELARKGHLDLQIEGGVMAYALRERDRKRVELPAAPEKDNETPLDDPLSEREMEVLTLLSTGRTNAEIARDLFVSVGTVKAHTSNIYRKLDAKNRAEALSRSREIGLLP